MKTFIFVAILFIAAPVSAMSNDRAMFMCTVGTAGADECPVFEKIKPVEPVINVPLQVKAAPQPRISATSTVAQTADISDHAEKVAQLKILIEQLRLLIQKLQMQQ